jgi:hypothetical protein
MTRGRTIGLVVAAVLLVIGVPFGILYANGTIHFGGEPTALEEPAATPSPGDEGATDWSLQQTFVSGDFVLEILSYQDSLPALNTDGSEIAERGQWVLIEIRVRNNGPEEGTFVPDQQRLLTNKGETYLDEPASVLRYAPTDLGLEPMAPGVTQTGYLAFDIPIDSRPVELMLIGRLGEERASVPLG